MDMHQPKFLYDLKIPVGRNYNQGKTFSDSSGKDSNLKENQILYNLHIFKHRTYARNSVKVEVGDPNFKEI